MKKGIFTVVFMMIITMFFISTLAFMNEISKERIIRNSEIQRYRSILYAFNIFPGGVKEEQLAPTTTTADIPWDERQVLLKIESQIKKVKLLITENQQDLLKKSFLSWEDSVEIFIRFDEKGQILAYGFPLKGKGLWGTITAFGVISSDLTRMIGIDFTKQVETPGLGARILENEFKYFFRNLDLSGFSKKNKKPIIMIRKKNKSNLEKSTNSLQAITGATQTCNGVLNMLYIDLVFYINVIKENEQLLKSLI